MSIPANVQNDGSNSPKALTRLFKLNLSRTSSSSSSSGSGTSSASSGSSSSSISGSNSGTSTVLSSSFSSSSISSSSSASIRSNKSILEKNQITYVNTKVNANPPTIINTNTNANINHLEDNSFLETDPELNIDVDDIETIENKQKNNPNINLHVDNGASKESTKIVTPFSSTMPRKNSDNNDDNNDNNDYNDSNDSNNENDDNGNINDNLGDENDLQHNDIETNLMEHEESELQFPFVPLNMSIEIGETTVNDTTTATILNDAALIMEMITKSENITEIQNQTYPNCTNDLSFNNEKIQYEHEHECENKHNNSNEDMITK